MTTVNETLVLPGGIPPRSVTVDVYLAGDGGDPYPAGYARAADTTIVQRRKTKPSTAGVWSLDLVPNANITPDNTVWAIVLTSTIPGLSTDPRYIEVPTSGSNLQVQDLLVDPPGALVPPGVQVLLDALTAALAAEEAAREAADAALAESLTHTIQRSGGREEDALDLGTVTGAVTVDAALANSFTAEAGGNLVVGFDNLPADAGSVDLALSQDVTGSRTVEWAGVEFSATPLLSTTGTDLFRFHQVGARVIGEHLATIPWTPALLPNLQMWARADQIVGVDNTPIAEWPDRSGNGYSLTPQSISSPDRRPVLQRAEINGRPIARFVTDDSLNTVNFDPTYDPPYSIITVVKPTGIGTLQRFVGGNALLAFRATGQVRFSCPTSHDHPSVCANGQVKHIIAVAEAAGVKIRVNAVEFTDAVPATATLNNIYAGSNSSLLDNFAGDIAEVIVVTRALTVAEIARVEAYLAATWGAPT